MSSHQDRDKTKVAASETLRVAGASLVTGRATRHCAGKQHDEDSGSNRQWNSVSDRAVRKSGISIRKGLKIGTWNVRSLHMLALISFSYMLPTVNKLLIIIITIIMENFHDNINLNYILLKNKI